MDTRANLKYVDADRLDTPAGRLDRIVLVSPTNAALGKLDGVIIDPSEHQVRYYVLERRGWFTSRHYLLPMRPSRLLRGRNALEIDVEADEIDRCEQVDPDALPQFSDDDLRSMATRPHAA